MSPLTFSEHVYDNVHGYIALTEVERKIVYSPPFQRLRHIKQMGLTSLVFPGAEHTRFAHSIGAVQIVERLTENLRGRLSDKDHQLLRLGALLHDIGHLPLSHTLEKVVSARMRDKDEENGRDLVAEVAAAPEVVGPERHDVDPESKLHEALGLTLIEGDHLARILSDSNFRPLEVSAIAMGRAAEMEGTTTKPEVLRVLGQMLHSQVDVDRIDYLLRDATFTGVEGGGFDLPKLYKEALW